MIDFQTDILIIGGGLAGLTAALHLQKAGLEVLLVEKNGYPHHKVCGEYISNEVLPYLKWLDADPEILGPAAISTLQFSTLSGKNVMTKLPLGGFGISRFSLDHFLYEKFVGSGGTVIRDTVSHIDQTAGQFEISTLNELKISARKVIGAYGKRSAIDLQLRREFMVKKSPFLAVKAHYSGEFDSSLVALHNFKGGYCGVSKVEDKKINICYLADYNSFKAHKNLETFQQKVLYQNKYLAQIFESSTILFESPLTISQLSFAGKEAVVDHILMIGDTAGLIHPLCGNGMSMAIHSAKICSELLLQFFQGKIKDSTMLERYYTTAWNREFKTRLKMGTALAALLRKERMADLVLDGMLCIPGLLPMVIKKTHGKTLTINR